MIAYVSPSNDKFLQYCKFLFKFDRFCKHQKKQYTLLYFDQTSVFNIIPNFFQCYTSIQKRQNRIKSSFCKHLKYSDYRNNFLKKKADTERKLIQKENWYRKAFLVHFSIFKNSFWLFSEFGSFIVSTVSYCYNDNYGNNNTNFLQRNPVIISYK